MSVPRHLRSSAAGFIGRRAAFAAIAMLLAAAALARGAPAQALELVMFGKNGCVWCARWERDIGAVYQEAEEARIAPLRRMDIRDQESAALELEEPIIYTPTFVLVDRGAEIGRITGYRGEADFWDKLQDMLPRDGGH